MPHTFTENADLNSQYALLSGNFEKIYIDLVPSIPVLTEEDFKIGSVSRFFLQKGTNRQEKIIEIAADQYQSLASDRLYISLTITWVISGPRNNVKNEAGHIVVKGVEETNSATVSQSKDKMPRIENKLKNPLQFWRGF